MATQRYYDDVLASLVQRVNYMDRRLVISETTDNAALTHSVLLGLDADDHTQYHNDARGDARYYTQARLQASGSASVHWDNITNEPSFAVYSSPANNAIALWNGTGGTLDAGGAATHSGTLTITGALSASGTLGVGGAATVGGTLNVSGAATLNSTLSVAGAGTVTGNFRTNGYAGINTAPSTAARLAIAVSSAATRGVLIDAAGTPSVPALHVRDSGSNDVFEVTPNSATLARYTTDQSIGNVVYRNQASTHVDNAMRMVLAMQTTTSNRFIGEMRAQLSDTTDATRTSYLAWYTAESGTYDERMRMASGNLGVGVTSPRGRLHTSRYSSNAMVYHINNSASAGTTTIIPDASGDVTAGLYYDVFVRFGTATPSTANVFTVVGTAFANDGTVTWHDNGVSSLKLSVSSGGAVTIIKTGAQQYYGAAFLRWV